MKLLNYIILSFCLLFAFSVVLAQETENNNEAVALDEAVTAEDLGIEEPTILPDNPFYFLKNLGRTIQSAITLDPLKKAELKGKFANERLIELRKLTGKTQNPEVIKKATENYQKEVELVKKAAEKIKEKAAGNNEVGKFLDKYIQQQTLQQRVLQKLETQVPTTAMEKIREAREAHLERFGEVMTRLENKEQIQERLEKNLEEVKGSEFKNFKNLEILKALEEKVPEAAKEALQRAQENALKRLQGDVEKMSPEDQTKFQNYIERIGGVKETKMEILENIRGELKDTSAVKQKLFEIRKNILEQVREDADEKECPEIAKPAPTFCQKGRVIVKKDEKGCIAAFNCVMPAEVNTPSPINEQRTCISLWKPVCGKNGKTYSNSCFAKTANIEVDYEGACKDLEKGTQIREQIKSLMPSVTQ